MKNPIRMLLPIFIVALLVVLSVGIAFARETRWMADLGMNRGSASTNKAAPDKHNSGKPAINSLQDSSTGSNTLTGSNGEAPPVAASPVISTLSQQSGNDAVTISHSEPITGEKEITGTVETIMTDTWTVSGQTFAVTPETEVEGQIVVGDKVKVELFLDQSNVLTASQIELLTEDDEGEDKHEGATTEFTGTVEAVSTLSVTVSGKVLAITDETEIDEALKVGDKVKVEALVNPDGSLVARQIELLEQNGDEDDNHNGECQEGDDDDHQGDEDNQQGQNQIICQNNQHDEHEGNHGTHQDESGGDGEHEGDD